MALIQSTAIPSSGGYEIDQSLRFNDDDSAYLSRTPASAGNRRTWTFSAWIKRGNLGVDIDLLHAYAGSGQRSQLVFATDDTIKFDFDDYTANRLTTTQKFRDVSAWYHIVLAVDTTQGTAANRVKIYVNGNQITDFSAASYPSQNEEGHINEAIQHEISSYDGSGSYLDGYLAEVNFIDGTAKAPADFGETGDYGEWKPIEYSGSYGTNGFYLPFKQDYTVEGFSTVIWTGTGANQYIGGTGFQPDFTWIKGRSAAEYSTIHDAVRGADKSLASEVTNAEATTGSGRVASFDTDGFSLGTSGNVNANGTTYVAWNWDMGGSNATNTTGSINSTVRANPSYGQSIVSYTGSSGAQTIGHGLSSTPEMIIVKDRSSAQEWLVYHHSLTDAKDKYLRLDTTSAVADNTFWNDTAPTNQVFSVGDSQPVNSGHGDSYIAYCFHSVTGYSKFGTYEGDGSTSHAITTGFKPAFVLTKNVDSPSDPQDWFMFDNTRSPSNPVKKLLKPNSSNAEGADSTGLVNFTDTGFTWLKGNDGINKSGDTFIYMAFADKREYAYWLDQSGNNNDWTSNNLTESDVMVDSPTNNFPTWDALRAQRPTLWEGNLLTETSTSTISRSVDSNFRPVSGKWYVEVYMKVVGTGENTQVGIANDGFVAGNEFKGHNNGVSYAQNGQKGLNNSMSSYGATYTAGDIIGIAYDVDNSNVTFYKNGASQGAITSGWDGSNGRVVVATNSSTATGQRYAINFGQDSSFAGLKVAQGNQDGNSIGDFYYTPPTGFLALCTSNLPDVAVVPSEHFNTVLYTGNATARSITGVGFQPDFVWNKTRSASQNHFLYDAVRGASKDLRSNQTNAEGTSDAVTAFNSDGFSVGSGNDGNENSQTYVNWNWKANGSGSSNTNGSINSTVSANVDAGFSIVSYTGDGGTATVGHGLSSAPEMIILKTRDTDQFWVVYHANNTANPETDYLRLNGTNATTDDTYWDDTAPTNALFSLRSGAAVNKLNDKFIAYCFHSVDGYSKVGSYVGNSNVDGTFVYTGHRPSLILLKRTDSADPWVIFDSAREPENEDDGQDLSLKANASDAEAAYGNIDLLSNGFKVRINAGYMNNNNSPYVYLCFSETPFKYSNAR